MKLAFAGQLDSDPFPSIGDARIFFAEQLAAAAARQPGLVHLSLIHSLSLFICLSLYLSIYLSLSHTHYLSICVCMHVCMSLCIYVCACPCNRYIRYIYVDSAAMA